MFSEATENGSSLWLKDDIHPCTKKVKTTTLIVVGKSGIADHTCQTTFIIPFISMALSLPKKPIDDSRPLSEIRVSKFATG